MSSLMQIGVFVLEIQMYMHTHNFSFIYKIMGMPLILFLPHGGSV
jgi:hypothetical protein